MLLSAAALEAFQAGRAGSIPVIRSHGSEADQRRFPMVCRVNHDTRLGRLMAFSG
jgi:hypothetical protein